MWNRIISFFILVGIIAGAVGFYYYFFVIHKGSLVLESNIGEYRVELYNRELKTTFRTDCESARCEIIDLAPFDYEMTLIKEGYESIFSEISIERKSSQTFSANFEKSIFFTPVSKSPQGNEEKIQALQKQTFLFQQYKSFEAQEGEYYYVQETEKNLHFLKDSWEKDPVLLYTFQKIPPKDIAFFRVYGDSKIILWLQGTYVLIDTLSWEYEKLPFYQNLWYAKKDGNILSLINDKGTFLYDITTKNLEYFYLFRDFLYLDTEHYVGIIYKDELQKKQNFQLSNTTQNLLVKYNHATRTLKVIKEIPQNVTKLIFDEEGDIVFYDDTNTAYKIENIKP